MLKSFEEILQAVTQQPRRRLAVANALSVASLKAAVRAQELNIADPVLFGDRKEMERLAQANEIDLSSAEIVDAPNLKAARGAALAVREGRADLLMKGYLHTDDFLRAVLDKESGLRAEHIMSHIFLLELSGRLLMVTDGAMNIAPDLVTKAAIIMNAVYLAHMLGNECPKVGVLAAIELVNPKMPATLDAAALSTMARRSQFPRCFVDGPFALDNAVSAEAVRVKKIPGKVAGQCDILLMPNIETGNALTKSWAFLAGGRTAGIVIGAAAPVVLTSRADSEEAQTHSIATAVLMAQMKRDSRMKIGRVHF